MSIIRRQVDGILLLDKPPDISSNGALQRVKRLFRAKKAGHTGSLDPIATGMLPLCFGEATKFSQFLLDSDKTYHVVAKLGEQTSTGDIEGEVIATASTADITSERLQAVMQGMIGEIEQVPPMFSALKHQGKPLYELARKGIEVERKPRLISIFSLQLIDFQKDEFSFKVHCSKGTYVRTLVEDIARSLNCLAHVTALRRVNVSPYDGATMYTLPQLEAILADAGEEALASCLLPVESSVQIYPAINLPAASAFYLRQGQPIRANFPADNKLVRLYEEDMTFLGMGEPMADGRIKPYRLIATN